MQSILFDESEIVFSLFYHTICCKYEFIPCFPTINMFIHIYIYENLIETGFENLIQYRKVQWMYLNMKYILKSSSLRVKWNTNSYLLAQSILGFIQLGSPFSLFLLLFQKNVILKISFAKYFNPYWIFLLYFISNLESS